MREYPIVCPSCKGAKYIDTPFAVSDNTTIICPACFGAGVVICKEHEDGE